MSIPRIAIHRPVTMSMISGIVVLLGAISFLRLPVDLMPDVEFPSLSIRVSYRGVGPLEMEELVTRPIEQAVAAVPGVDIINSTSSEGSSTVRLSFTWGTDLNEAADDVRSRLDRVRGRLPDEADPPTIFKFDATAAPIVYLGVEGEFDRVQLREIAEQELSPRLERVPGVASVEVNGGLRRQIRVELSKEKIAALDLSVDRVINLLRTENQNIPVGEISEGDTTYLLRSQGQFTDLEEIGALAVMTKNGVPVYLRDIAEVKDTTEDVRSVVRINGRPGVRMQVTKQSGKNTVEVAKAVRAEVERINREVDGIRLVVLNDTSRFIERAIAGVREAVLLGSVLVVAVIFVFLRNLRSTIIICTSIPISVIGTFALLYFGGYTLNTLTFGGLALGIGMIVDASIVVLENTFRHMELGKSRLEAAIFGSEEVWSAILASTLTHIAVFVPLFFLSGVSSIMFKQLSAVVIFSLAMSLFVAVTLVPVMCSRLLRLPTPIDRRGGVTGRLLTTSERWFAGIDESYRRLLHTSLQHRPTVLAGGTALFIVALLALPYIGYELMPQTDEGQVNVNIELPVGTRFERTQEVLLRVEEAVRRLVPEAETIVANAGGGGGPGGGGPMGGGGSHRGSINVYLVPKRERQRSSDQIRNELTRELAGIPGTIVRVNAGGGNMQMNRLLGGGGGPGGGPGGAEGRFALEIQGHDLEDARRLGQEARQIMESVPDLASVRVGREEGRPELAIRVDRQKAATFGMTVTGVANTLRTNVAGTTAAYFRERGSEYPIIVRLREEDRERVADVSDILLSTPQGRVMPAKNVLQVGTEQGPVQIERKNQERITRVNAEVLTTLSDAVRAVEARLPALSVPPDFRVGFGSEVEEQAKAFRQLQLVLILAIVLVYAVMAAQYESLRDPFIIMFSVPLAAIGVVGALLLTNTPFSMQAYVGVIMLAGIVVSNAILLVDYTNILRRRDGLPLREAVERAGRTRLRPILMTSLTTILGLIPMALGWSEGGELQAPLARAVIGGLATSTVITLVFVPTVYTIFEEGVGSLWRRKAGKNAPGLAV